MKWLLQSNSDHASQYTITAEGQQPVVCKYNALQQIIRLKCGEQRVVYILDKGSLGSRKFFMTNIYGSITGWVNRNMWKENAGVIFLQDFNKKTNYQVDADTKTIRIINGDNVDICEMSDLSGILLEDALMLALVMISWGRGVSSIAKSTALAY